MAQSCTRVMRSNAVEQLQAVLAFIEIILKTEKLYKEIFGLGKRICKRFVQTVLIRNSTFMIHRHVLYTWSPWKTVKRLIPKMRLRITKETWTQNAMLICCLLCLVQNVKSHLKSPAQILPCEIFFQTHLKKLKIRQDLIKNNTLFTLLYLLLVK